MKIRTLPSAALAAAALSFSLLSPASANADTGDGELSTESAQTNRSSKIAIEGSRALRISPQATNHFSTARIRHAVLLPSSSRKTWVPGTFSLASVPPGIGTLQDVTASVRIGKRVRGTVPVYTNGLEIPSAWGAGAIRVGPFNFIGSSGTASSAQYTNTARVRQGLYAKPRVKNLRIVRKGSKLTFSVKQVKSYTGKKWQPLKRATVQYKSGNRWKRLKIVRLNKWGGGKFSITRSSKRTYRLFIPTTVKIRGGRTGGIRI